MPDKLTAACYGKLQQLFRPPLQSDLNANFVVREFSTRKGQALNNFAYFKRFVANEKLDKF